MRRLFAGLAILGLLGGCQAGVLPGSSAPSGSTALPETAGPTATTSPRPTHWRWVSAGSMAVRRIDPHAIPLAGDRVLVVGNDAHGIRDDSATAELYDPATNTWRPTTNLYRPRVDFVAAALPDGRVLVSGGMDRGTPRPEATPADACYDGSERSDASSYLYDSQSGRETWSQAGPLGTPRTDPAVAVLPDGHVLVVGGYFESGRTAEEGPDAALAAYRPTASGAFSRGPVADSGPLSWLSALATAEVFDPTSGTWSPTGSLHYARYAAAATTLADGRVLVVGSGTGWWVRGGGGVGVATDARASTSAEIYDPRSGRFTLTGDLPMTAIDAGANEWGTAGSLVALPDGGALLVANTWGVGSAGEYISTRSFRYDARAGSWSEVGRAFIVTHPQRYAQTEGIGGHRDAAVARLPDGRVFAAGGESIEDGQWTVTSSAVLFDPATNTWSALPRMPEPRAEGAAVALPDGSVLVVGGYNDQTRGSTCQEPAGLASAIRLVPSP